MHKLLMVWGIWKRNNIIGLGYRSSTIESKIMSGQAIGDGNKGGARLGVGVHFIENPRAESVDLAVKNLEHRYSIEMKAIKGRYITEWSIKRISLELRISKYHCTQILDRAKTLIEGRMDLPKEY